MGSVPGYERGCNIGAGNRVRVEESAVAAHATPRHVCKCVGVRALGTRAGGMGTAEETSLGSLGAGARWFAQICTFVVLNCCVWVRVTVCFPFPWVPCVYCTRWLMLIFGSQIAMVLNAL